MAKDKKNNINEKKSQDQSGEDLDNIVSRLKETSDEGDLSDTEATDEQLLKALKELGGSGNVNPQKLVDEDDIKLELEKLSSEMEDKLKDEEYKKELENFKLDEEIKEKLSELNKKIKKYTKQLTTYKQNLKKLKEDKNSLFLTKVGLIEALEKTEKQLIKLTMDEKLKKHDKDQKIEKSLADIKENYKKTIYELSDKVISELSISEIKPEKNKSELNKSDDKKENKAPLKIKLTKGSKLSTKHDNNVDKTKKSTLKVKLYSNSSLSHKKSNLVTEQDKHILSPKSKKLLSEKPSPILNKFNKVKNEPKYPFLLKQNVLDSKFNPNTFAKAIVARINYFGKLQKALDNASNKINYIDDELAKKAKIWNQYNTKSKAAARDLFRQQAKVYNGWSSKIDKITDDKKNDDKKVEYSTKYQEVTYIKTVADKKTVKNTYNPNNPTPSNALSIMADRAEEIAKKTGNNEYRMSKIDETNFKDAKELCNLLMDRGICPTIKVAAGVENSVKDQFAQIEKRKQKLFDLDKKGMPLKEYIVENNKLNPKKLTPPINNKRNKIILS